LAKQSNYGIGIDVGSTTTKAVLIDTTGKVKAQYLLATGASAKKSVQRCLEKLAAISKQDLSAIPIISTGYGRSQANFATKSVTEITCHGIGVHSLNQEIQTLIDIGGQDSKVIRIGSNGRPTDFELNDKCSAGTGRFLEVMAQVLEIPIQELGSLALKAKSPSVISSTCTVFAESEVIGRIGAGDTPTNIAAGIHKAMAAKIATLAQIQDFASISLNNSKQNSGCPKTHNTLAHWVPLFSQLTPTNEKQLWVSGTNPPETLEK
jgi:predicted CoA-substrate-specific enzyme activase